MKNFAALPVFLPRRPPMSLICLRISQVAQRTPHIPLMLVPHRLPLLVIATAGDVRPTARGAVHGDRANSHRASRDGKGCLAGFLLRIRPTAWSHGPNSGLVLLPVYLISEFLFQI
jgi:hypothetical protein